MLVVADSSSINFLIQIEHIDVLPRLFGRVVIPPEVAAELSHRKTPETVRKFMASPPPWLETKPAHNIESIPHLDPGGGSGHQSGSRV